MWEALSICLHLLYSGFYPGHPRPRHYYGERALYEPAHTGDGDQGRAKMSKSKGMWSILIISLTVRIRYLKAFFTLCAPPKKISTGPTRVSKELTASSTGSGPVQRHGKAQGSDSAAGDASGSDKVKALVRRPINDTESHSGHREGISFHTAIAAMMELVNEMNGFEPEGGRTCRRSGSAWRTCSSCFVVYAAYCENSGK